MKPSVERFTGFADVYDQVRPSPPEVIADLLLQLAQVAVAGRVVDAGCGSGLSMMMWGGETRAIIWIEPSREMGWGRRGRLLDWSRPGICGVKRKDVAPPVSLPVQSSGVVPRQMPRKSPQR